MSHLSLSQNQTTSAEDEAALTLLMLGGCPKCGKSFNSRQGNLVCCHVSYCPICARPHTDKCSHIAACSEWGHWNVGTVAMRSRSRLKYPLPPFTPLDFSPQQWKAAFGDEWEIFVRLWGSTYGWTHAREKALSEWLMERIFPDAVRADIYQRYSPKYLFYRAVSDGDTQKIHEYLARLKTGMEQLSKQVPTAYHYLRLVLEGKPAKVIEFCQFSTDGSYLVWGGRYQLNAVHIPSLTMLTPREKKRDRWLYAAGFTGPDRLTLKITNSNFSVGSRYKSLQEWCLDSDSWTTPVVNVDSPVENNLCVFHCPVPQTQKACLHGEATEVTLKNRQIYLSPTQTSQENSPAILTVKARPTTILSSPDGEHFVTISTDGVLLWRARRQEELKVG